MMGRRVRPPTTQRSEHWMRVAVNDHPSALNSKVSALFNWDSQDEIRWLSPLASDDFAEYFDQGSLDQLGVRDTIVPLHNFWPRSGPRWDALGSTKSGK